MEDFLYFFSFQDANIRHVTLGCITLGGISGLVGSFAFFRKQALVGDAVAHALLPGVCVAFLLSGEKIFGVLLVGAMCSGVLGLWYMQHILKHTKLKQDTAIALVLSVFFGFGIFLLTYIQHGQNAAQSGLNSFLFGKAAALLGNDMLLFFALAGFLFVVMLLFFKEFVLLCFDGLFARSLGVPAKTLMGLLTGLTLLCIVLGIQAVGVVLVAALLITPAAAAHFWTFRLRHFLLLAVCFGAFSGLFGAYVSYIIPHMPTGPWIVLILSGIAMVSFLLSPKKGVVARWWILKKERHRAQTENIMKSFYQLGEEEQPFDTPRSVDDLQNRRFLPTTTLRRRLWKMTQQKYLVSKNKRWHLSPLGLTEAKKIIKKHRLWELYLSKHLDIPDNEVHEKADRIEHVLNRELSQELEELLGKPKTDPHNRNIPA